MSTVFYLGPSGTFTHEAALLYFQNLTGGNFEACLTPPQVMQRLTSVKSGYGVVPIENSIQGEVIPTLDALCFEFSDIFIIGEVSLPVSFNFFGTDALAVPRVVMSHPHALAQCKRLIASRKLQEQTSSSTSEACRIVAERKDPAIAALASPSAGRQFGLTPLQVAVEDFVGAYTRFLILSKHFEIGIGANQTMLALVSPSIDAGIIAEFSGTFAMAGVNILEIHTRPLRTGPGHYLFIMTVTGSPADKTTRGAVDSLLTRGYGIKILGTYCPWPGIQPAVRWPHIPGLLDSQGVKQLVATALAVPQFNDHRNS